MGFNAKEISKVLTKIANYGTDNRPHLVPIGIEATYHYHGVQVPDKFRPLEGLGAVTTKQGQILSIRSLIASLLTMRGVKIVKFFERNMGISA